MVLRRCRARSLVIAIAALGMLAGCSDSTSKGTASPSDTGSPTTAGTPQPADLAADQTLRIDPYGSFIRSFDPGQQNFDNAFARFYTETLLKPVPDKDDVTGAAAESFDVSADGLTYTFHLRADGRYSDGQPVKAADFVYAWSRVIDPRLAAPAGAAFASVVKGGLALASLDPKGDAAALDAAVANLGLAAPDDRTFRVTLPHPLPEFKWIATQGVGSPIRKDIVDRFGADKWATKAETLITNGPFKTSEIVAGQSITWVPNPSFRDKPILTKITSSEQDVQPAWTSYLNSELDVSNGPPEGSVDAAIKDPATAKQLITYPVLGMDWATFNTTKAPFDNPKVRLAFAQAVDRDALTKAIGPTRSSGGKPATTLIPSGIPGYDAAAGASQGYDPAKAKVTLAASGANPDSLKGIHLLASQFGLRDAQLFQDQIKQNLGIDMTVDAIGDFPTLNTMLRQGNFQIYQPTYAHQAVYPGSEDFLDLFLSNAGNANNATRWKNAQYDDLVQQADASADQAKRLQLFGQAQRILLDDAPIIVVSQVQNYVFFKPWVQGVVRTAHDDTFLPGDFYVTRMYIAKH